mmetsp:Transcript_19132/g.48179  ORF Transcript_19132/g.48179 Transcript_19132/m.48179 type:complete len:200 (-) Transcript_19132:1356-1955(-)
MLGVCGGAIFRQAAQVAEHRHARAHGGAGVEAVQLRVQRAQQALPLLLAQQGGARMRGEALELRVRRALQQQAAEERRVCSRQAWVRGARCAQLQRQAVQQAGRRPREAHQLLHRPWHRPTWPVQCLVVVRFWLKGCVWQQRPNSSCLNSHPLALQAAQHGHNRRGAVPQHRPCGRVFVRLRDAWQLLGQHGQRRFRHL